MSSMSLTKRMSFFRFLMTALQLLGKLVETFGPVIHATRASSPSLGVDLHAEQRYEPQLHDRRPLDA